MALGKIGVVCMVGEFNKSTENFKSHKDTTIGVVTRKSLLQICNIDDPEELTHAHVDQYRSKLKAKVMPKVKQNLAALYNQLVYVSKMPTQCQMFRISSNLLPMFDHEIFNGIYDDELLKLVDVLLTRCKRIIDLHSIRVCTHPDQFNVINSDSLKTRTQTFRCLRMHKHFMERLTDDININIHLNGKLDHIPEFDNGEHLDMIPCLNFENEDKRGTVFVASTINTLEVCEKYGVKMLFDIHHDRVLSGEFLNDQSIIDRIVATWGNTRPIFHISQGKEHEGDKKHGNFIDNHELVQRVVSFLTIGDVECEAKGKTTAVRVLHELINKM